MIRKKRRTYRTREQKYPDTDTFKFYNANPKGRITGDCVFRAFSLAMDQDYNQTVMEMAELMCETGWALNDKYGEAEYLKRKGWIKQKQPRKADNTKYTGEEFCKIFDGTCVAHIGGHHMVCIKDHKVWDIWNSTDGCIGNYWIKE
jgi:hypothetical protein